ncbi:cation:proton antiporter domain-containing protein [Occultella gossypii]|uniref:Cation:proton antiporter n=1 Tax=Occultella gossypii TaxID=2800820 RepID=A0ABS7S300_9MICO|nr:cation:proton antiporter [Occultella gossypii]MBZ2194721.1 cation:proton antiporter [Occultella gossypii]
MHIAAHVFLAIAVIMLVARLFARLAGKIQQPPVVGEIIAGIALGPSILGLLPGDLDAKLFPPDILPYLDMLAQLGLVLFMFIVGLELDMTLVRGREKLAGTISLSSVILPFAMGAGLTFVLYPFHNVTDAGEVPFLGLALFLGIAMAITAFPVLARILTDRGMHRTTTGVLALACAAVDDILAWTLLAFVVAVVQGDGPADVIRIVVLTAAFAALMFGIVRPLLKRLVDAYRRAGRLTPNILAIVLIGVLASSVMTDVIGIHAIFGAFIFGAVMPRQGAADLTREILERLEQVSVLLLLPLFFVVTGLSTNIGGITGAGLWQLALIMLVAVGGKFGGAFLAARLLKVPSRQATALGVLMNTRGLTELVILQIGRQLGVLDGELFTLLVLMAILTTMMTGPLLRRVYPDRAIAKDIAAAERAALGVDESYRVLVLVDDPAKADRMAAVAATLLGTGRPGKVVLSRFVGRENSPVELGAGLSSNLTLMAATVDDLNALASRVHATGVPATVLSRFTADPWADLLVQAETAEAAVLLMDADWFAANAPDGTGGGTGTDLSGHRFSVATVRLAAEDAAADAPIVVIAGGDPDGRGAVLAGAAAARARGAELLLHLPDGARLAKRFGAALAALHADGLGYRVVERGEADAAGAAMRVVAAGLADGVAPSPGTAAVTLWAGQDVADAELTEALGALVTDDEETTGAPTT